MTAAPDFFPSVSRQELREREKKEEKEETPVEEKVQFWLPVPLAHLC